MRPGCGARKGILPWVLAVLAVAAPDMATAQTAQVTGRVRDARTAQPLTGVAVSLEGSGHVVLANDEGRYLLLSVPPGPQVLRAERLGYATRRVPIIIPSTGTLVQDIEMAGQALEVEGLIVTADPASRARGELGTASVIEKDAIRSQTATSLTGLLALVPGMELRPPTLEGVQQISLRAMPTSGSGSSSGVPSTTQLASFGTLIVMDGVPLSNNANLQSLGSRGELSFGTAASGGVDLRRIPASMIERVEVLRGVPSARFGDLTQGTIIVDTRAGAQQAEVSTQYDRETSAVSFVWGRNYAGSNALSAAFNMARSRSSPGVSDDQQYRFASQVAHRAAWSERTLDSRFDVFVVKEDRPENANIRVGRASWTRDRGFRLSERFSTALGGQDQRLTLVTAYSRVEQAAWSTAERVRGGMPFTDRITEGRSIGRFVQGRYDAQMTLDGTPQLLYTRLEVESGRTALGGAHDVRAGVELRREWTGGAGYQFDMEFPPQVNFNSVQGYDRPRRFDAVSPLATSSAYLDDRYTVALGSKSFLTVQAGLRLDLLHRGGWWASAVQDRSVQPRLSVELALRPGLRVRGGWGRTTKTPALGSLHPPPQFHDIVNVNYFAADPVERLAILTTSILDTENDGLGFSRATKLEFGIDGGWHGAAFSFVLFKDRITGGVGIRRRPTYLLREHYQLTDSILGNGLPPEIIEPSSATDTVPVFLDSPANHVDQVSRGFEFTAFSPEIRPLRTRLQVQASWIETRQWSEALDFGNPSELERFQLQEAVDRSPYWRGFEERGVKALMTYRVIHHQPEVGLVVTATVQHNIWDELQDIGGTDSLSYEGYVTEAGQLVVVPPGDRNRPEYVDLRRSRSGFLTEVRGTPSDWMLGLQVSKTLPLSGRVSFWAFNAFDEVGTGFAPGVRSRFYPSTRFGLELVLRPAALRGR